MGKGRAKKSRHKQKLYSVLISKMFPSSDPIAIDLVRLMSGCNDIYFLEEWADGTKQLPKSRSALSLAGGRNFLQLRLMYSCLREALRVIHELKKRSEFEQLRPSLGDDGERALTELISITFDGLNYTSKHWGA